MDKPLEGGDPENAPYFTLSEAATVISGRQAWQTGDPHTLSVVAHSADGFAYYGYVGQPQYPQGGPIGLFRSNDLLTWTNYASNPIDTGRWPSVVKVGETIYMSLTKYGAVSHLQSIQLLSSSDGLSFTPIKTTVAEQAGYYNDGSNLFYNPNDNLFYLYWANIRQSDNQHVIAVRSAADPADLDTAPTVSVLAPAAGVVIASPSMMYYDGLYYLAVETKPGAFWYTNAYTSASPTSGFVECSNSPILSDDSACYFQHIFGGVMHAFYSHRISSTWSMLHRQATLP